jgi:hypothetical protein
MRKRAISRNTNRRANRVRKNQNAKKKCTYTHTHTTYYTAPHRHTHTPEKRKQRKYKPDKSLKNTFVRLYLGNAFEGIQKRKKMCLHTERAGRGTAGKGVTDLTLSKSTREKQREVQPVKESSREF